MRTIRCLQYVILTVIFIVLTVNLCLVIRYKYKTLPSATVPRYPLTDSAIPTVFVSFAGGGNPVHIANQDMQKKPNQEFIPNLQKTYYETDKTLQDDYYTKLSPELKDATRGFHYWSWKPYVTLRAMYDSPDGVVIIYLDTGAFLKRSIQALVEFAQQYGSIFFNNFHDNTSYCKCEPVQKLLTSDVDRSKFRKTLQLDAAFYLVLNNSENRKFMKEWLDVCLDYSLVSDSKSKDCSESSAFHDHRHDQALLTLVAFKYPKLQKLFPHSKKHWYINHHRRRSL